MGALDGLLEQVKSAIVNHATANKSDPGNLLSQVTEMFGKHPHNAGPHDVKPASQDPYGDPADQKA